MFNNFFKKIIKAKDDKDVDNAKGHLKRFAKSFIVPNKYMISIALIFMVIFSAANAGLAYLIKPIVNNVFSVQNLTIVYEICLALVLVTFVKTVSQYIYTMLLGQVAVEVIASARKNLYQSFLKQDMKFYHKNSPGTLVSVMMNEINAINTLATEIPINLGRDLFTFLGLLVVMFVQEPFYAGVMFFSIFFIVIPIVLVSKKIKSYFAKTNLGFGALTTHLEQSLNGIKEVKSYGMEAKEIYNTNSIIKDLTKVQLKVRRASAILPSLMELLGGLTIAGILAYGSYRVVHSGANTGSFFSFIGALLIAYQPLKRLTEFTTKIQMGILGVKRYHSFIDTKPHIVNKEDAKELKSSSVKVVYDNVKFKYDSGDEVLKGINFSIAESEKIALVGRSGGGKSTIMNLLPRFYDVNEGKITINGEDIRNFTIKSLRQHISFVSQDVVMFDGSVYENILYGRENATREEVIEASKKAYCFDFIDAMPDGFETQIGARGMKLSGGQRQRISIARAILKNAPILLLDEATSALDTESEKAIQKALETLMVKKTTLVIAHRLSTIIHSDKILVVDKGEIIEQGSHEELLNQNGFYKYLYDLQFKNQNE